MVRAVLIFILSAGLACAHEVEGARLNVLFSPNGHIADSLCDTIVSSDGEVLILASKFTNKALGKCLSDFSVKGGVVRLILDVGGFVNKTQVIKLLAKNGVCVYSDARHKTAHNKVMVIGKKLVFTGSYNFTSESDQLNAENALIIDSLALNKIYREEFKLHFSHSELVDFDFKQSLNCVR